MRYHRLINEEATQIGFEIFHPEKYGDAKLTIAFDQETGEYRVAIEDDEVTHKVLAIGHLPRIEERREVMT